MAKTVCASILALILLLQYSLSQTQPIESAPSLQDFNQTLTSASYENTEGYPTGCKLYKHRKLLQCRNAGILTIPELKEDWHVTTV